ncbi:MAG: secretin N-terminal domain-containing protein [Acidobacteriota bacterium]
MHPTRSIVASAAGVAPALRWGGHALAVLQCFVLLCFGAASASYADAAPGSRLQVYAYTLKHQQAHEVLPQIRPLLSARGTVEVQPGGNTLVVRETQPIIDRIARLLDEFDHPPEELRFDIQIVRAGPKRSGISPPQVVEESVAELPEPLAAQLREYLRYDDYRVLAEAGVQTREGEEVTYALGKTYSVSFKSGTLMSGQRVKLEGFRIVKQVKNPSNKGRQLAPRELFHATLNLWLDRPFNLVLTQDEKRKEALMVAISCRREKRSP